MLSTLLICLRLDPNEYLPPVTLDWCQRRLQGLGLGMDSESLTLEERTPHGIPKHAFYYTQLRNILQAEVFNLSFQLPRCHPPTGGYNWTQAITNYTSSVSTLSLIGEEDTIEELDS